ncbi:hypothetical protein FZEAL_9350 [Fusarium zealandicum]|uniref:Zn(2)-C6 fungal-type domain-containing protein n=1 Tax=Fusarium zealandicum TaxID=1053134 RepID=A0A8H4UBS3_9HYPO|nr:hypothetical protein FZEAL_9350 [Fusarium zealandicum]
MVIPSAFAISNGDLAIKADRVSGREARKPCDGQEWHVREGGTFISHHAPLEPTEQANRQHWKPSMFPSTRKNITRSRNGCAVCKSKRLKCDEAKPSCSRCERLGIPCPGYKKPLKWTTASRTPKEKTNTPDSTASGNSPDWATYTFNQPQPQPPDQSIADFYNSDFLEQFTSIIETGSMSITDHSSFESPFPFEELSEDMRLQSDQTPATTAYLGLNEDELWTNTLLTTAKPVRDVLSRLDSPNQVSRPRCEMPLAQALQDHTSILVEYYFKEVCGMMSCYDSPMNPYRTTISNVWSGSQSLYYVTQSMAAACLSEVSPNLSSVGRQLRDQAMVSLSREARGPRMETSSLLALVMLGMSLCWHDPGSVGQSEFELLAKIVLSSENCEGDLPLADKQKRFFFHNSLVYWQMLLAFVTDREPNIQGIRQSQPVQSTSLELREPRMPHPQTGIGIEVQKLVAKVGSLVRKERKRIRSRRFASRDDIEQAKNAILAAEQLHSELCAIELPQETAIVDSGDDMTPADHLLKIAEAYRCTGLLQLYRNFPDLLPSYIPSQDSVNQLLSLSTSDNTTSSPNVGSSEDAWLTCLALHIHDLVKDIPVSSRSRSIQPLLLVSICSELALGRSKCSLAGLRSAPVTSIASGPRFKAPLTDLDILRARRFIISRLSSFENILAAKPIRRMLLLVKETWAWMEERQQGVYWMDVMMEKGYETLMG